MSPPLVFRLLRREPFFAVVSAGSLALGIALTTVVAGILDAVANPIVPYESPDRLYRVMMSGSQLRADASLFRLLSERSTIAQFVDDFCAVTTGVSRTRAGAVVQDAAVAAVTPNFFAVLRVKPELGRFFAPSGDELDIGTAVVSSEFWKQALSGGPLGGLTVTFGQHTYSIIGVAPEGLRVPGKTSIWIMAPERRMISPQVIVRLTPGVDATVAETELRRLTAEVAGSRDNSFTFALHALRPDRLQLAKYHVALALAASAILIIGCANLANLMLMRGLVRRRELGVRLALGAGRAAIVRHLMGECLAIGVIGLAGGVVLATWGVGVLRSRTPEIVDWIGAIRPQLSWRVFGVAAGTSVLALIGYGLAPASVSSRVNPMDVLKDHVASAAGAARLVFKGLVASEVALATILMIGAALLLKAAHRIEAYDFGYDPRPLWSVYFGVVPGRGEALEDRRTREAALFGALVTALRNTAGTRDVSRIDEVLVPGGLVTVDHATLQESSLGRRSYWSVAPNVMRVLGVPIVQGRDFAESDVPNGGAAIVDQRTARAFWPQRDPIGRLVTLGITGSGSPRVPVVGVIEHVSLSFNLDSDVQDEPALFVVGQRQPPGYVRHFVVRAASGDPATAFRLQQATEAITERGTVVVPWSMDYLGALTARRFIAALFALFAGCGVVLAAVGLYGVLGYLVNQRKREIAVRVALGADALSVLRYVVGEGLLIALTGSAFGSLLALGFMNLLGHWLYTVSPTDISAIVLGELLSITFALIGCLVPAAMAMRVEPREALNAL